MKQEMVGCMNGRIGMIPLALLSACLFSGAQSTAGHTAQDEPSFQDSAVYIQSLMTNHGFTTYINDDGSPGVRYSVTVTKIEPCHLSYTDKRVAYIRGRELPPNVNEYEVYLEGLDPTSLKAAPFQPTVPLDNQGLVVQMTFTKRAITFDWPIDTPDNATHLINALSHAITLCGGKKAAF
jgi:hypothetical protein